MDKNKKNWGIIGFRVEDGEFHEFWVCSLAFSEAQLMMEQFAKQGTYDLKLIYVPDSEEI